MTPSRKWEEGNAFEWLMGRAKLTFPEVRAIGVAGFSMAYVMLSMYTAYFGQTDIHSFRSLFLTFLLVVTFLARPLRIKFLDPYPGFLSLCDFILVFLSIGIHVYTMIHIEAFELRGDALTTLDMISGVAAILLVMEGVRRFFGKTLSIVALAFLVHARWADHFPWILYSSASGWGTIMNFMFIREEGLYGMGMMVFSSILILFLIFGSLLSKSGVGMFFIDLANAAVGKYRGGPAKISVISSSLFGTVSGSAIANVVVDGVFTIPMMKRMGFRPHVAAAVEALTSTGGQIMPPMMGISAFLMAEILDIPYWKVCLHAAIPALLYYVSIYWMIHFESVQSGLKGLPSEFLPKFGKVLSRGWHLMLPLVIILHLMVSGYTAQMAALMSIISIFILSFVRKETRFSPKDLLSGLVEAGETSAGIGLACVLIGVIIGSVALSGLGINFSAYVLDQAKTSLFLALLATAFISLVLGMGLPTVAVYIVLVSMVLPSLIKLGHPPISIHLFGFYFGVLAAITPPVAVAAYAAAAIGRADPFKTGWYAVKIGVVAFIIPFLFMYDPELLIIGTPFRVVLITIKTLIMVAPLAGFLYGQFFRKTTLLERALLGGAAIFLIIPGLSIYTLLGLACLAAVVILQRFEISGYRLSKKREEAFSFQAAGQTANQGEQERKEFEHLLEETKSHMTTRLGVGRRAYLQWIFVGILIASIIGMGLYSLHNRMPTIFTGVITLFSFLILMVFWVLHRKGFI